MTHSIMPLSKITLSIITLTRMTAEKLSTMSSSIMPLSKMTFIIMTLTRMTAEKTQHHVK